jgi:hypothetical protein
MQLGGPAERERLEQEVNYLVLLLNEGDNEWERGMRIHSAFKISRARNIPVVPFILSRSALPEAFFGLVYIDGTKSFKQGIEDLKNFVRKHSLSVNEASNPLPGPHENQPRQEQQRQHDASCIDLLSTLDLSELRFRLSERLTLADIRVLWFDVFNSRMEDDVNSQDRATCCLEILDRSDRHDKLEKLIDMICRNHPGIGKAF